MMLMMVKILLYDHGVDDLFTIIDLSLSKSYPS